MDRAPPPGVLQPHKGRAQQRRKALATQPGQLRLRHVVQIEDVDLCSGTEAASQRGFFCDIHRKSKPFEAYKANRNTVCEQVLLRTFTEQLMPFG